MCIFYTFLLQKIYILYVRSSYTIILTIIVIVIFVEKTFTKLKLLKF